MGYRALPRPQNTWEQEKAPQSAPLSMPHKLPCPQLEPSPYTISESQALGGLSLSDTRLQVSTCHGHGLVSCTYTLLVEAQGTQGQDPT